MEEQFARTAALIGEAALDKLRRSRVILFGLGGVGSFTAEMLARSGVGALTLVDSDAVAPSNLNRQLEALHSTVGMQKTEAVKARIADINPACRVTVINRFYLPENADAVDLTEYDCIADAIDTVSAKLELISRATALGIPIVCCMGTGNKLDPTLLRVSDIGKTEGCPLCRVMRRELKARDIKHLQVVWSPEQPVKPAAPVSDDNPSRHPPASMAFVPAAAGIILAREIIMKLIGESND